jgi:hypothetical protein
MLVYILFDLVSFNSLFSVSMHSYQNATNR